MLKDVKNNGKTMKSICVKSHGNNINLHPVITKLLNAEKVMLKKNMNLMHFYAFYIFDKIRDKYNKFNEYRPKSDNNINKKNAILEYLKIIVKKRCIKIHTTSKQSLTLLNLNSQKKN